MASNSVDNLFAHYAGLIDAVTDTLAALEARVALDEWRAAKLASMALSGRQTSGYSMAGRSLQFRTAADAEAASERAMSNLRSLLGLADGGIAFVDLSGGRSAAV